MLSKIKCLCFGLCFGLALSCAVVNAKPVDYNSKDIINNSIIVYPKSDIAFVNGTEVKLANNDDKVAPYLYDNQIFVPLNFLTQSLKGNYTWDAANKAATLTVGNRKIIVVATSNRLTQIDTDNTGAQTSAKEIYMDAPAQIISGNLYVSMNAIAKALDKQLFVYDEMFLLGDDVSSLSSNDSNLLDSKLNVFTQIRKIGSNDALIRLLGYDVFSEKEYRPLFPIPSYDIATTESAIAGGSGSSTNNVISSGIEPIISPSMLSDITPMYQSRTLDSASEPPAAKATKLAEDSSAQTDFSATNVQVQGVDEADIVKTDGEYIYYLTNGKIQIVKTASDGTMSKVSEIAMNDSLNFNEFFIDKNKIIAIGTYYKTVENGIYTPILAQKRVAADSFIGIYPPANPTISFTKAVVYNVDKKESPTLEREVEIKGHYLSSRKIGNSIYFVSDQYVNQGYDVLPAYKDTAVSDTYNTIECRDIYYFPRAISHTFTSVVGFNINDNTPANLETFLGSGNNIYMSENNLYISTNYSSYNFTNNMIRDNYTSTTQLYKYKIGNGMISLVAEGSVPGYLLNQFSLDEYNGNLRVATTTYKYTNNEYTQLNCLFVLDDNMKVVGKIDDLAPGERIYSTRFMGEKAYMVTFKQVDPLFVIDLKNPTAPKVLGALKIPGYSDYLHPYDENHLIGFGKDTTVNEYGNAYYLGMKMALFDVTDPTNPKEMFVEKIGDRGTDSQLLNNHKSLLFSKEKNLLAFPVSVYSLSPSDTPANSNAKMSPNYGEFTFAGAYVYNIDLKNGFNLKGKISHLTAEDMLKSSSSGGNYEKYIDRLLYIKDILYSTSPKQISSNDLQTLKSINTITFE